MEKVVSHYLCVKSNHGGHDPMVVGFTNLWNKYISPLKFDTLP